jgi:DNA-binding LacI/PurR family transcriptional regulator
VQRTRADPLRQRDTARPQLGPVGQVLLVREGLLVEQRLAVARAQDREIAPGDDDGLLDEILLLCRVVAQGGKAGRLPRISPGDPRVTSVDVARAAGVSQSTVSLVLSGKSRGRISARTEEAVRRAAEELGYRPNVAARALRTGRARSVGFVVPDVTHPFFGRTMRGAQEAAATAGYAVTLVDVPLDGDFGLTPVEALREGPADGFIYFSVEPPAHRRRGEQIVVIEAATDDFPWVRLAAEEGTDAALEHLLALGHRRIARLGSWRDFPTFELRRDRWLAALERVGVEPEPSLRAGSVFDFVEAARAAGTLLDVEEPPTAIICDDDILAGGVYLAARDRGLSIPGDVSVVGFDDLDFAQVLTPPLTTISADAERLGGMAFETLAAAMGGELTEHGRVLPVELVVRESTGPPRAR